MNIQELLEKIKPFYIPILLIVVSATFFGLGRLSAIKRPNEAIQIEYPAISQTGAVIESSAQAPGSSKSVVATSSQPAIPSGEVIGSKSGKKYYFPWCGTVKRIKPENQVHFDSIEAAKAAGFTPGGNCKGIY